MKNLFLLSTLLLLAGCKEPSWKYKVGTGVEVIAGAYEGCSGRIYDRYYSIHSEPLYELINIYCNEIPMSFNLRWMHEEILGEVPK